MNKRLHTMGREPEGKKRKISSRMVLSENVFISNIQV